eukprot:3653764-Rhodomonas_salina.1
MRAGMLNLEPPISLCAEDLEQVLEGAGARREELSLSRSRSSTTPGARSSPCTVSYTHLTLPRICSV